MLCWPTSSARWAWPLPASLSAHPPPAHPPGAGPGVEPQPSSACWQHPSAHRHPATTPGRVTRAPPLPPPPARRAFPACLSSSRRHHGRGVLPSPLYLTGRARLAAPPPPRLSSAHPPGRPPRQPVGPHGEAGRGRAPPGGDKRVSVVSFFSSCFVPTFPLGVVRLTAPLLLLPHPPRAGGHGPRGPPDGVAWAQRGGRPRWLLALGH